jgi:ribosomal protein S18 acetylase RimI-like enzyme
MSVINDEITIDNYNFRTKLRNGTPITIRPIKPEDKVCLMTGFERLSMNSRQCRFLSPVGQLSDYQINYLTEIDYTNHFALCASDVSQGYDIGAGIARYIRCDDEPETAEFAVAVIDAYQNQGLGKILLDLIIHIAQQNGINRFVGYVSIENIAMQKFLENYQANSQKEDDFIIRYELDILDQN